MVYRWLQPPQSPNNMQPQTSAVEAQESNSNRIASAPEIAAKHHLSVPNRIIRKAGRCYIKKNYECKQMRPAPIQLSNVQDSCNNSFLGPNIAGQRNCCHWRNASFLLADGCIVNFLKVLHWDYVESCACACSTSCSCSTVLSPKSCLWYWDCNAGSNASRLWQARCKFLISARVWDNHLRYPLGHVWTRDWAINASAKAPRGSKLDPPGRIVWSFQSLRIPVSSSSPRETKKQCETILHDELHQWE